MMKDQTPDELRDLEAGLQELLSGSAHKLQALTSTTSGRALILHNAQGALDALIERSQRGDQGSEAVLLKICSDSALSTDIIQQEKLLEVIYQGLEEQEDDWFDIIFHLSTCGAAARTWVMQDARVLEGVLEFLTTSDYPTGSAFTCLRVLEEILEDAAFRPQLLQNERFLAGLADGPSSLWCGEPNILGTVPKHQGSAFMMSHARVLDMFLRSVLCFDGLSESNPNECYLKELLSMQAGRAAILDCELFISGLLEACRWAGSEAAVAYLQQLLAAQDSWPRLLRVKGLVDDLLCGFIFRVDLSDNVFLGAIWEVLKTIGSICPEGLELLQSCVLALSDDDFIILGTAQLQDARINEMVGFIGTNALIPRVLRTLVHPKLGGQAQEMLKRILDVCGEQASQVLSGMARELYEVKSLKHVREGLEAATLALAQEHSRIRRELAQAREEREGGQSPPG